MVSRLEIEDFLKGSAGHRIVDVRSPSEYLHAHIPAALSLPLFSDEERAAVGTAYKKEGREAAMMLGLDYYGKNMKKILASLSSGEKDRDLYVHCWRGGMRSGVVGYMLDLFGYRVHTLAGGYKSFRQSVLSCFQQPFHLAVVGGKTGSRKTGIIRELKKLGETVIDLEALAHHKGSAFGGIGEPPAPGQEQFENNLYWEFRNSNSGTIWIEDESQRIGNLNVPNALWSQMRTAEVYYIEVPFEERLQHIAGDYGPLDREGLKAAVLRIRKRLGGLETSQVLAFLNEGALKAAFSILLKYYDKVYMKATESRVPSSVFRIHGAGRDVSSLARQLLKARKERMNARRHPAG